METIMKADIVQNLSESLNEEKWTRATLNNYVIKNFSDLDNIIDAGKKSGTLSNIRKLCSDHLLHTPNSIIALYVIGKLNFEEEALDEGHIQKLINLFNDNKRFNIVEFLSNKTLEYGENKYALDALAQCMLNDNREKELNEVWERLVKIDYEEADITRKLATVKEKEGKIDESIDYYKKALLRYLKKQMYNPVEEIWLKLIELIPDDLNFFLNTEKRIANTMGADKSAFLLSFIVPYYREKGEHDTAIDLLKKTLGYNQKDKDAREELVACYMKKYESHSLLNDYLEKSGFSDPAVEIQTAIDTFEKHIVFDVDNYVYHRTWEIGKLKEIKEDSLIIKFKHKPKHRMTLQMALSCLQILPEDHIWLLKSKDPEKLRELFLSDVEKGLRIIIKSKNNAATVKDFKGELLNGILDKKEWTKWWGKAKTILKKNHFFGTLPEKNDVYFIRKKPISYEEDIYNKFKTEKNFDKRFSLFHDFHTHGDIESEYFEDMLKYFTVFTASPNNMNENSLKSFLLLKNLKKTYSYLPIDFTYEFHEILQNLKDIHTYLPLIPDNELKKNFLMNIRRTAENWPEIFIKSFYVYPIKFIIEELIAEGKNDLIDENISNIFSHYREFTELFIWIIKNLITKQIDLPIEIDSDQAIIGLTHLLEISSRELNNERNVVYNRKLFNTIVDILFKDALLIKYINESDVTKVKRLMPTILNIHELKDEYIIKMRFAIKTTHPEIVFEDEIETVANTKQLLVTQRTYELKQGELKYLLDVAIPQNSKEIGQAMEKGDLRENAEYKYALEKQEFLKHQVKSLTENLNRAQILKPEDIKSNIILFGTMITLNSIDGDKTEKYTILGPWESDPSKKIISYTSPIGETLMNKAVGDSIDLGTKNNKMKYKILKIEKAIF
ncbi:MAG TPA: transcription elongation factor GreA [Spirochaetes bacterium]|nr:transcription elongation factor GreA [Spirochaetota bacterium]